MAYAAVLGIFMLSLAVHALWDGLYSLPATYDTLAQSGVPVELHVTRCARGINGDKGFECVVRLSYAGETRDWTYPHNVHDRVGAGLRSSNTAAGVVCALFATLFAVLFEYSRRRAQRLGFAGTRRAVVARGW